MRRNIALTVFTAMTSHASWTSSDIGEIKPDRVVPAQVRPATHLPETGNPWTNEQTAAHALIVRLNFRRKRGRGPTTLISRRRTLMNWGSSSMLYLRRHRPTGVTGGIPPNLEQDSALNLVRLGQLNTLLIGAVDHGTDLDHLERFALYPNSFLSIEDRAAGRDLYC